MKIRSASFDIRKILSYMALIFIAVLFIMPFAWTLLSSLKMEGDIITIPPRWFPHPINWIGNYKIVWETVNMPRVFYNTIFIAVTSTAFVLFTSSIVAYGFARLEFVGRRFFFVVLLSSMMIPAPLVLIPTFVLVNDIGLMNNLWGVIIFGISSPFGIFLLRQFIQSIPAELSEAAKIDGCRDWNILWRIIFPLMKPGLVTLGLLNFIGAWNNFLFPMLILQDISVKTLPLVLNNFVGIMGTNLYGPQLAIITISTIPLIIIFLIGQRYFVEGVSHTGLK